MDIKLILLDLDDTLLNSSGELSARTISAVHDVAKKGIVVAIASGRMNSSILPYVKRLNINGPIVSYNGALIKDYISSEVIYSNPVPLQLAQKVLSYAKQNNIFAQFYTEDEYFFEKHCDISEMYYQSTGIKGVALGTDLEKKILSAPPKILLIEENLIKIEHIFEDVRALHGEFLNITQSKNKYIEVMNKNVNKGQALLRLCEEFGFQPDSCMAVGDGLNDLEMIEYAGCGVAVNSANEALKEAADIICGSPDDDGPAKIIEILVLNKG